MLLLHTRKRSKNGSRPSSQLTGHQYLSCLPNASFRLTKSSIVSCLLLFSLCYACGCGSSKGDLIEQAPVDQYPVEQAPVEQVPAEQVPAEQVPVEQPPVDQSPVEQPPVEQPPVDQPPEDQAPEEKIDDWAFNPSAMETDAMSWSGNGAMSWGGSGSAMLPSPTPVAKAQSADMGLSVGGAKGIENFRENIENNYLPLSSDLTYEGLFYHYYFDTGKEQPCSQLFCPSYTQMRATDPLSAEKEYFLSVGLNSDLSSTDFKRKKLNLVVVLDISGSMGSAFNAYYYDKFGNKVTEESSNKTKMVVANESLVAMLDHLEDNDRLGMVLFESRAFLAKPLSLVKNTDMEAIKSHILEIHQQGGTNMEAGYKKGSTLFDELTELNPEEYENRIIFLTDAMPNTGNISDDSLLGMVANNAKSKIFTTFIGIGVDFNTQLIEAITKVQGANYYSVHSEKKFKERMDEEFDYMVTPLVFDLQLNFASTGFAIEAVYGSPEADQATGCLMKVNTLFPSKVEDGETKGGIIILKLKKTGATSEIKLSASYKNREGKSFTTDRTFSFNAPLDVAPNTGIQKGILLSRYARLVKQWIQDERTRLNLPENPNLSPWERQSVPLVVSSDYTQRFTKFMGHMKAEMDIIGDPDLDQEIKLLEKLATWKNQ